MPCVCVPNCGRIALPIVWRSEVVSNFSWKILENVSIFIVSRETIGSFLKVYIEKGFFFPNTETITTRCYVRTPSCLLLKFADKNINFHLDLNLKKVIKTKQHRLSFESSFFGIAFEFCQFHRNVTALHVRISKSCTALDFSIDHCIFALRAIILYSSPWLKKDKIKILLY